MTLYPEAMLLASSKWQTNQRNSALQHLFWAPVRFLLSTFFCCPLFLLSTFLLSTFTAYIQAEIHQPSEAQDSLCVHIPIARLAQIQVCVHIPIARPKFISLAKPRTAYVYTYRSLGQPRSRPAQIQVCVHIPIARPKFISLAQPRTAQDSLCVHIPIARLAQIQAQKKWT